MSVLNQVKERIEEAKSNGGVLEELELDELELKRITPEIKQLLG